MIRFFVPTADDHRAEILDEADGKRYLRRYDALRLVVGRDRESALVQVRGIESSGGMVEYHLGDMLEHVPPHDS